MRRTPPTGQALAEATILRVLEQTFVRYLDAVVAALRSDQPVDSIPYPDDSLELGRAFADAIALGRAEATRDIRKRIIAGLRGRRPVWAGAESDPLLEEALIAAEQPVVPWEAIEQYLDRRIVQSSIHRSEYEREAIKQVIGQGAEKGYGVREITKKLLAEGLGIADWHRRAIARTESALLYNRGKLERYAASPIVAGYRIDGIADRRQCPICAFYDGRIFKKGEMDGYTPPYHVQCRCTITPIFEDEMPDDALTAEEAAEFEYQPRPGFGRADYEIPSRRKTGDVLDDALKYATANEP